MGALLFMMYRLVARLILDHVGFGSYPKVNAFVFMARK